MSNAMEKLSGLTLAGMGLEMGKALFFFTDGTMATVSVEPREPNEAPRDVLLTVSTYELESDEVERLKTQVRKDSAIIARLTRERDAAYEVQRRMSAPVIELD